MPKTKADELIQDHSFEPVNDDVVRKSIIRIGAELRNDLNNPLQEIVALAHVTSHGQGDHKVSEAIQIAAKGLAEKVNSIEERLIRAIEEPANDS